MSSLTSDDEEFSVQLSQFKPPGYSMPPGYGGPRRYSVAKFLRKGLRPKPPPPSNHSSHETQPKPTDEQYEIVLGLFTSNRVLSTHQRPDIDEVNGWR